MDDRFDLLHADVRDIKGDVKELLKASAIHNTILLEHEKRSTNLEERFKPIEDIYTFAAKGIIAVGIVSSGVAIAKFILAILK